MRDQDKTKEQLIAELQTLRAQAGSDLRAQALFYDQIFRSSAVSTWIADEKGTAILANPACLALFGATEEEVIGKYNIFQDEVLRAQGLMPAVEKAYATGQPSSAIIDYDFGAVEHVRASGATHKIIQTTITPIRDATGRVTHAILQAVDLTDMRRTEEALRESEERLALVIKGSNDAIWDWDMAGHTIYYAPQWWAQLGYEQDELPADEDLWARLLHPEDQPRVEEMFSRGLAEKFDSFELEFRLRHKDGHWVPVLSRGFVTWDEGGQPARLTGSNLDLTERKRAEEKLRAVLDATPFPVAVVDQEDDQIHYWSRSALQKFGHTAPTAPAWHEIAYPDPDYRRRVIARWKTRLEEAREAARAINAGEYEVTCADGSVRTCELYAAFVADSLIVTFHDITEQKALAAQLAQADRLSSMGTLAAGVAHEINNPLAYVLYNLESLADDLPGLVDALGALRLRLYEELGAEQARALLGDGIGDWGPARLEDLLDRFRDARAGTRRIRDITRGLGAFSRVDHKQRVPVDLARVIEAALDMASNEIRYRARLIRDFGPTPPVLANEGRLSQVFLNLIINAAQAIAEGDVDHNEIRVRTWAEGASICASVSDTGSGIEPDHLPRLFEPFFTTKAIGEGSGLGLAISQQIIESSGGTISVESAPGQGTCFTIRLPQAAPTPAPREGQPAPSPPPPTTDQGRILVVDDEERVRAAMVRMLPDHQVVQAGSGREARRILEEDRAFDLILCDMMMPEVSGMELHAWLAASHPALATRLVFVTGGAFTPRARDYLAQVDTPRLEKPFDAREFKRVVQAVIRRPKDPGSD